MGKGNSSSMYDTFLAPDLIKHKKAFDRTSEKITCLCELFQLQVDNNYKV